MNPALENSLSRQENAGGSFRRPLFWSLCSSLALLFLSAPQALAQCPNGQPQHPVYGCGDRSSTKPTRRQKPQTPVGTAGSASAPATGRTSSSKSSGRTTGPTRSGSCKIQVQINFQDDNAPLNDVTVYLSGENNLLGKSDEQGELTIEKLPCNQIYRVIPSDGEFEFTPPYYDQVSSRKTQNILFLASRRKTEPPPAAVAAPPCSKSSAPTTELKFGESVKDQLNSTCQPSGEARYSKEYALRDVLGGDIVHLTLGQAPSADLFVQAFTKTGQDIKVEAASVSGAAPYFKIELPVEKEFLLRIASNANQAADFELKLTRAGLSNEGYIRQLQKLYETINETGNLTLFDSLNSNFERLRSNDPVAEQKLTRAFEILEQLRKLRPDKPQVYAMLSAIYLYQKKDIKSAAETAIESLKLGGEARFRTTIGRNIDKKERRILTGARNGWLVLQKGEVFFEAFSQQGDRKIFSSPLQLLRKKDFNKTDIDYALSIYGRGVKDGKDYEVKDFDFIPLSLRDIDPVFQRKEVATIKVLLKDYIQSDTPIEIRQ